MFNASEFNWEADAWRYVFGLIRDDDTFRMYELFPNSASLNSHAQEI
jgi:hypothetical protein